MVKCRKATVSDVDRIISKIQSGSFSLDLLPLDPLQAQNLDEEEMAKFVESEYSPSLSKAVDDGRLLVSEESGGLTGYSLSHSKGEGRWVISALDVDTGLHKAGIGSGLAEKTLEHLRDKGGRMAEVSPAAGVHKFWEKMGFRPMKKGKRLERRL
ncbi:MAG: GNAT family N-acetyltransferase [Candidatus Diapherotrites archaeon]|nr:GNAT family N-acetyltransferase [Candidatus Diapherotrites archaeon]